MAECWHIATRPPERHGYGLTPLAADRRARRIERAFTLLPDGEAVYREWRRLIVAHAVSGVQVYDARLVAVMKVHDVTHLLTLNDRDVARYAGITVVHPSQVTILETGFSPEGTPQTPPALRLVFPVRGEDVKDCKRYGFSGTTAAAAAMIAAITVGCFHHDWAR
jgi:predicted nucleic acid-binding protein